MLGVTEYAKSQLNEDNIDVYDIKYLNFCRFLKICSTFSKI